MIEYEGFRCEFRLTNGDKVILYVDDRHGDIDLEGEWIVIRDCQGRRHSIKDEHIIYSVENTEKTKMILAEMKL
jgi:hypothetical protein